jgi:hypothetical protein
MFRLTFTVFLLTVMWLVTAPHVGMHRLHLDEHQVQHYVHHLRYKQGQD